MGQQRCTGLAMCVGGGCHLAHGSEGRGPLWGPQQDTLCFCQRKGVASFWEDGLWEVLPQSTSLTCETELEALSWVAYSLLLSLCPLSVCGQGQLFWLFSKGEVLSYAWRNFMFLVQQRNLNCSIAIKKAAGEALSDIIHPREVSYSYIEKSIY